jgi:hypothetical protein
MTTPYRTKMMQDAADNLAKVNASLENSNGSWETATNAGLGVLKVGAGIAALFQKTPDLPEAKPTYQKNPNLAAGANLALADAFSNQDDLAARVRAQNVKAQQEQAVIENSGGQRSFVAANSSAIADAFNTANLAIDDQQSKVGAQKMANAASMGQLALYDELNQSRDLQSVQEMNYKRAIELLSANSKRVSGAAELITGGLTNVAEAAANNMMYGKDGYAKNAMRVNIAKVAAMLGAETGKQEDILNDAANKLEKEKSNSLNELIDRYINEDDQLKYMR